MYDTEERESEIDIETERARERKRKRNKERGREDLYEVRLDTHLRETITDIKGKK